MYNIVSMENNYCFKCGACCNKIAVDFSKRIIYRDGIQTLTKEFEAMFAQAGYRVKTLRDYPDLPDVKETGKTFEENARLKAETIANILQCPVLADDSGLTVDALGG